MNFYHKCRVENQELLSFNLNFTIEYVIHKINDIGKLPSSHHNIHIKNLSTDQILIQKLMIILN